MLVWLTLKTTTKGDFRVKAFLVNFFMHSPKRYLNYGQILVTFRAKTLRETKICNLHPKARRRVSQSIFTWKILFQGVEN